MSYAAVPVSTKGFLNHNVGTGFFVKYRLRTWLVTAAHLSQMRQPTAEWAAWPSQLYLKLDAGGSEMPLLMFNDNREPRFAYERYNDGHLADYMALPVSRNLFRTGSILAAFERHDLNGASNASVGGYGSACGYRKGDWLAYKLSKGSVYLTKSQKLIANFLPASADGLSGGPLIDSASKLIGPIIGNTGTPDVPGEGIAVSPDAMRAIIDLGISRGI